MKVLTLQRVDESNLGTLGELYGDGVDLRTVENPDRDNAPYISRIPSGIYTCRPSFFHRGGYPTFEVTDVPDRSRILFHVGNTARDVEGCIAVGLRFGRFRIDGVVYPGVQSSRDAFDAFMAALGDEDAFELRIYDVIPELPMPDIAPVDSGIHPDRAA